MTRTDWLAGVKHAYYLDRTEIVAFAGYQTALAVITVIAGAAIWWPVVLVCLAVMPIVTNTVRRARNARDSREFYQWMISQEQEPADVE